MVIDNIKDLINNEVNTSYLCLNLLEKKELLKIHKYLQPQKYDFNARRLRESIPRVQILLRDVNQLRNKPKNQIINDIIRFGFNINQIKL